MLKHIMDSQTEKGVAQKNTAFWPKITGGTILVLLVAAGTYTALQIGPYLPDALNRLAAAAVNVTQTFIPSEKLNVYINPTSIESGNLVNIAWSHPKKSTEGIYSLSYPCIEGVFVGIATASGDRMLDCETLNDIYSENNLMVLKTVSESVNVADIPLSLIYTRLEDTSPSLQTTVTLQVTNHAIVSDENTEIEGVRPEEHSSVTETMVTTPTVSIPSGQTEIAGEKTENIYSIGKTGTESPYGKPDLAPRIIEIGTIDKVTNEFTSTTTLRASGRVAVRFEVENLGTADSGVWYFSAVLPTFPLHIFQSESQQSLAPGDRIEYTIGFDNVQPDKDGRFVVNVDPNSSLPESSEDNNLAETTIRTSL